MFLKFFLDDNTIEILQVCWATWLYCLPSIILLTYLLTHLLTHSLTNSLTLFLHSLLTLLLSYSLAYTLAYSLTLSLTHSHTLSLFLSLTLLLSYSLSLSITHLLTHPQLLTHLPTLTEFIITGNIHVFKTNLLSRSSTYRFIYRQFVLYIQSCFCSKSSLQQCHIQVHDWTRSPFTMYLFLTHSLSR